MIQKLHIAELEGFLAESYVSNSQKPLFLQITKSDDQGNLEIDCSPIIKRKIEGREIDFDLSPCECIDLDRLDINEYKDRTIYSSSAIELFEYFLMFTENISCIVEFEGVSWKVKVL